MDKWKVMGALCLSTFFALPIWAQEKGDKEAVDHVLEVWHKAAADADFGLYFAQMTEEGVFLGTDASENWQNKAFKEFSKPYFDRGKAWNFTTVERNIYVDATGDFAWFDELLETQMELCRGSGVLKKIGGQWKIAHYVLSITIPNDLVDQVTALKKEADDRYVQKLKKN
jgi:ketosteroid isomerase-like protein